MSRERTLTFSAADDALFSQLVRETIVALRLKRGKRRRADAAQFSVGDYVGGQADMGCDQEIHLMLEYAEVIGHDLKFRVTSDALPRHLSSGARFGIGLLWAFECFLQTTAQWHPDGYDHPVFSYDPFEMPTELTPLAHAFVNAQYLARSGTRCRWAAKAKPTLGLLCWGSLTDRGVDARNEAKEIYAQVPTKWKEWLEARNTDITFGDMRHITEALSNDWYMSQWNDAPVRGSKDGVYMRSTMGERVALILKVCV